MYLEQMAETAYEASILLIDFLDKQYSDYWPDYLEQIVRVRSRGDKLLAATVKQMRSSFISPIDHEDLLMLFHPLLSIVEIIELTARKLRNYKLIDKNNCTLSLANILLTVIQETRNAVSKLDRIKNQHTRIIKACDQITLHSRESKQIYESTLASFFQQGQNAIEIMKWKEVNYEIIVVIQHSIVISRILRDFTIKYV